MKVLYLVNFAGKAGIEKYVENLARLLPERGAECCFAYNIPGELSEKLERAGIPCLQLDLSWANALGAARTLAGFCRERGIEVIHAQCPRENVIALLARRLNRSLRVVYTEHFNRRVGLGWRLLYRHFTPENHRLIAVCRASAASMAANGCRKDKIQVVYNGIDPAQAPPPSDKLRRELALPPDTLLMVSLSRLSPEKGVGFLVRALAELKARTDRPFCCAVAGDGPMEAEVRALAEELGVSDRLRLLGYRTDTAEILASADLYVCPSASEALSFALLEAMNAGLPLAVTAVGGNVELVEDAPRCGLTAPYGDAAAFAGILAELLEQPERRETLSRAAKEKIRARFDLNQLAGDVYNTYC